MSDNQKELWKQIEDQFQKLLKESNVEIDETYGEQMSEYLNLSQDELDELENETIKMLSTKKIKVQKVHPDAVTPSYAYPSDSGFDLYSVESHQIPPLGRILVSTGIKLQFDENLEIQIRPKSGLAYNQGVTVLNTPGTVDSGYNGEIKVIIFNTNDHPFTIEKGTKIAQAVLCPVINGKYVEFENVDDLSERDRGENGFGSTGT